MWKCLTRRWVFFINTIDYYKSLSLPVCGSAWLVDEYFLLILLIIINLPQYLYVEVLDTSMSIFLLILLIIINLPHYL